MATEDKFYPKPITARGKLVRTAQKQTGRGRRGSLCRSRDDRSCRIGGLGLVREGDMGDVVVELDAPGVTVCQRRLCRRLRLN